MEATLLQRALGYVSYGVTLVGVLAVAFGLWAWFAAGRTTGLAIALAIVVAGPLEDRLMRRPRFGLAADEWAKWVDQFTSLVFLLLLIWATSLAL